MKLLTFIAICTLQFTLQSISVNAIPNMNMLFVKDYLKFNNIPICVHLTCENITDTMKNRIDFRHADDVWLNWWGVSKESELRSLNYNDILVRLAAPMSVVIDLECDKSVDVLKEISRRKMFHFERFWIMFGRNLEHAYAVLENQFINMDAEIHLVLPANDSALVTTDTGYRIFEAFNPSYVRGGKLNVTQIGHWNLTGGVSFSTSQTKIERRHDLKRLWFHTATAIPSVPKNKTFIEHLESDEFPFIDSGDKNNFRLMELIKNIYDFNLIVHRAPVWGILSPNGTWKGVIGMLSRDEIDFAVPAFRWANERYSAFEHTTHSYHIQYVFMFLHPKSVNTSRVYLSPFNSLVWCLIIFIGIGIACALRQTIRAETRIYGHRGMKTIGTEDTYSKSTLIVFGLIVQQGYSGNTLLISSRILITAIMIFSIVTFQFYSSFIVASLLVEAPKTITTVEQLLNSELICSIDEIAYIRDHIEHYNEESVVQLYKKITAQPNAFVSLETGVNLIKMGGHAFYTDGNHGYQILEGKLTDQEACDLQEVKYVQKVPGGPGVPRKSPFKELIKISLRRITETGLLSYHWRVWIGHKPKCANNRVHVVPVDLLHFSTALYVSFVGMQISVGILFGEMAIDRYLRRNIAS